MVPTFRATVSEDQTGNITGVAKEVARVIEAPVIKLLDEVIDLTPLRFPDLAFAFMPVTLITVVDHEATHLRGEDVPGERVENISDKRSILVG